MTTTTAPASSTVTSPFAALLDKTPAEKAKDSSTASSDRFLTMLVTQLQNQDPLNPMDNAQITSQMAQINAVTGLDKVNESVKSLGSQFLQMQLTQGAALVGREVAFEGDRLSVNAGVGRGAFELSGASSSTKVEVLDGADRVVATLDLGPQSAGRHNFDWSLGNKPAGVDYHFRVSAALGKAAVAGRTLVLDRVQSVSTTNDNLSLTLARNGTIAASNVVAYN
jgi:flagellar basal-body rod modification protein FlgD